MNRDRIGSLVHNARNRLGATIDRLQGLPGGLSAAAELHVVCSQLASAMALLRLDGPEAGVCPEQVDLTLFFADLSTEMANLAPGHLRTEGKADFSGSPFPYWTFDSQLVRLALIDALMNAWRHARQAVRLEASCRDGELHFAVLDDGPGFPAAWLAEPPSADTSLSRPHGTGQGLHLARRIAGMHGTGECRGRIVLANDSRGGAVFRLVLP